MRSRLLSALNKFHKEERGFALPMVFILLLVAVVLMPQITGMVGVGVVSGSMYDEKSEELYAADAGAQDALWLLAQHTQEEMIDLIQEMDDEDGLRYIYDLPEPIDNKTVHCEIMMDDDEGYIIESTATAPDGSSTTVEVWCINPEDHPSIKFSSGSLDGELIISSNLGSPDGTSIDEAVGTGDGVETLFELDYPDIVKYSEVVTVNGVVQERDTNYTVDYANGWLTFVEAPGEGDAIVATYDYIGSVNFYANGDIKIQGSAEVYGEAYYTPGHTIDVDKNATFTGEGIQTRPLQMDDGYLPDISNPDLWELIDDNYTVSGTQTLGWKHITGNLTLNGGATLYLSGPIWVDGQISATASNISILPEGGEIDDYPFLVSDYPIGTAISIAGGEIQAVLYTCHADIHLGGNAHLNGAAVGYGNIDIMGTCNLKNAVPLKQVPISFYPMSVLMWKIC